MNVENVGKSPIHVTMAYVDCAPVYLNGTDTYLAVSTNPILPGQESTIAAFYKNGVQIGEHVITYFTIVTGDGSKIIILELRT